ncbi:MAG: cation:proton antiporter [Thiotrichales bacterium]|nr:cation:proton antiporter [Thiotrichales bacterium]
MGFLEIGLIVIGLMVLSMVVQERLKIPMPVTLISVVLLFAVFGYHIEMKGSTFDAMLMLLLPLLISSDVLNLKPDELKKNWLSVVLTAGVVVVASVVLGVLLKAYILPHYDLSIPAMVALMAMVVATDPVTVSAVFSNFRLPHHLKFIAESESLFNDASAFVIFGIALTMLAQPMTADEVLVFSVVTIMTSFLVGLVVGVVGILLLKLSNGAQTETAIILLVAYLSFEFAEYFEVAAIFSLVVSMVVMNAAILSEDARLNIHANRQGLRHKLFSHLNDTYQNHPSIVQFLGFAALLANVLLYISIGEIIDLHCLLGYWKEILAVFVATSLIRALMMWRFKNTSHRIESMETISFDWWVVLTFAGVKGGLSILMVHMLPETFAYKDLFTAIILGNIILTTFVYSLLLTVYVKMRKVSFSSQAGL